MRANELQKFHETVGILVKAYLNDTLEHGRCSACVVGNLCGGNPIWSYLFVTDQNGNQDYMPIGYWDEEHLSHRYDILQKAKNLCLSTGYSIDELKRIELTFETTIRAQPRDQRMFMGLMRVVDVLAEIHKVDLSVKESSKLLFVKS